MVADLAGRAGSGDSPDLPDQLDLAPELRLVSYTFREEFGRAPHGVWMAPGIVTLLADGPRRLRVAAPWGAMAAAEPRTDGQVELLHVSRPRDRVTLTVAEAVAGEGPSWASAGLRAAVCGATLLVATDLPDGSGLGAAAATQTAISLALRDMAAAAGDAGAGARAPVEPDSGVPGPVDGDRDGIPAGTGGTGGFAAGAACLAGQQLPCDLAAAGLRLMVIDTRVRTVPRPAVLELAQLDWVAGILASGRPAALGPLLTSAHMAVMCHGAQEAAVSAALRAGALGARMVVDGPGRPVCALVPAERLRAVRKEVAAEFDLRRRRAPRFLTFTPAAGPRRAA